MARLLALFLLSFQAALGEDGEASCILQSHFPFQNMMLAQHNRSHHFDQGVEHLDDDALLEEDQGEYLGSQTNRVVECTSDEEEYDLVPDSPGRLLSHNEELASGSGVRFDQFDELSTGTTCHYGAAIWTKATNRAPDSDEDLQKCGDACRLLIVADQRSDFSSDPPKIDDCRTGPTRIDLRFDKATKVLGYNFWDNDESTSQNTKLFWRLEHTPSGWDGQATVPRTADGEGTGFQSIAAVSTPPQSVVKLRIQYAGSGGLKSLRLCRPKATAPPDVTCPNNDYFDLYFSGPGRFFDGNSDNELAPGTGIYFDSFNPRGTENADSDGISCIDAAMWTGDTNRGGTGSGNGVDRDLRKCPNGVDDEPPFCNLLIVAESQSRRGPSVELDDCKRGPTDIYLRLDPPRKVLGFEYWDNDHVPSHFFSRSFFTWRNVGTTSWDYWGVDQTAGWVQIPETNDGEGTGFVNIADHFIKPDTVDKIQIVFSGPGDHSNGDGGALRSLRVCNSDTTSSTTAATTSTTQVSTTTSRPGDAGTTTTQGPVQCPFDPSSFQDFNFYPGVGRKLSIGEEIVMGKGIYLDSFTPGDASCEGAGIWTRQTNRDDDDLLGCTDNTIPGGGCNLLVVVEDQSLLTDPDNIKIDDCGAGGSTITLRLDPPQPVLQFTFFDNEDGENSKFKWEDADGTSEEVNIPVSGDNQSVTVDISGNTNLPPNNVKFITITYGGSGGLKDFRRCPPASTTSTTTTTTAGPTTTTTRAGPTTTTTTAGPTTTTTTAGPTMTTTTSRPGDAGTTTTQGPVQCPFDPSSFQDFNFYPGVGRKLSIDEEIVMGKGIYLDSFTPGDASCEGAGIWTRQTNRDDDDLLGCTDNTIPGGGCNLLVVVEDQSLLTDPDNIKIDDCGVGGSTITLRLDPPQPVLQFTFFDNEDGENSKFKWEDADGTSEEVNIPVSGDNKSITVDISGNTNLPPNNVKFITITYGGSGGLKDFRLCPPASTTSTTTTTTAGPTTTTTTAEPTTTTTTAGPTTTTTTTITTTTTTTTAPPPPPPAAPPVECPSGSLPYNFSFRPGMGRQLSFNEEIVTDSGVFFAGVSLPPSPTPCIGAGIWTPITNLNDGDLLGCPDNGNNAINGVNGDGCNLLVVLEDESQLNDTSNIKIDDCRQGGSIISLQLVPPQPVLSYSFWDNENGEGSLFTWQNENGASNTVNIPVSGNNNGVTEDISTNQQLPPNDVQFVNVTYGGSGGLQTLRLCSTTTTTPMVNEPPPTTTGAVVEGDPHIHTFEGEHYLLLNQGTFDLWHLSGLQTSFVSNVSLGLTKKVDVNWQVYTHYSGSKSFTKAILVVDKSGGHLRQMAELTSKDCQWRIRMPGKEWEVVKESKLFFVPDGLPDGKKDYVTGFKVGLENQHLKMSMNTEQGKTNIAGIYTTCRPAHFLNLKLHMMRTNSGDEKFVKGEMRGFQRVKPISGKRPVGLTPATASALQLDTEMQSTDEEFSVKRRWQELGGSELTAEYLEAVDEKGPISHFLGTCDEEAKREAHAICAKHLGAAMAKGPEAAFFNDCVTDVCNGAGEVAAELAAELRVSSRRKDKD